MKTRDFRVSFVLRVDENENPADWDWRALLTLSKEETLRLVRCVETHELDATNPKTRTK